MLQVTVNDHGRSALLVTAEMTHAHSWRAQTGTRMEYCVLYDDGECRCFTRHSSSGIYAPDPADDKLLCVAMWLDNPNFTIAEAMERMGESASIILSITEDEVEGPHWGNRVGRLPRVEGGPSSAMAALIAAGLRQ